MELKKLIKECCDTLQEEVMQEIQADDYSATVTTESGDIYLSLSDGVMNYILTVEIVHNDNEHESPNLEAFLEKHIDLDWDAVTDAWREASMDEWQAHGFRDEADFWRWKEG